MRRTNIFDKDGLSHISVDDSEGGVGFLTCMSGEALMTAWTRDMTRESNHALEPFGMRSSSPLRDPLPTRIAYEGPVKESFRT